MSQEFNFEDSEDEYERLGEPVTESRVQEIVDDDPVIDGEEKYWSKEQINFYKNAKEKHKTQEEEVPPVQKAKTQVMIQSTGMGESIPKRGKKKLEQSAWFLTIVINKPWKSSEKALYDRYDTCFLETLNSFWKDEEKVKNVLQVNHGAKNKQYETLKAYFTSEQAPDTTYLHAHGVVLIIHRIWIRLIYARIQTELTKLLNQNLAANGLKPIPGKLYLHGKFVEEWKSREFEKQSLEDYINKHKTFGMANNAKGRLIQIQMDDMTDLIDDKPARSSKGKREVEETEEEHVVSVPPKKRKEEHKTTTTSSIPEVNPVLPDKSAFRVKK